MLDQVNFSGASLIDSDLTRASLQGAVLDKVDASGVDLRGADLREASLHNACLTDVDLRGADLTGADLHGADLRGVDLRGAIIDGDTQPQVRSESFSPAFEELAAAVGPVVAQLLREGSASGLLEDDAQARMMEELRSFVGVSSESVGASPKTDAAIDAALRRAAETGLEPLLEALRQGDATPPQAVATMLKKLSADLQLGEDATAEDLVARLAEGFKKPRH